MPKDFAMPVLVDTDSNQGIHIHHAPVLAHFEHRCIGDLEGIRALIEGRVRNDSTCSSRSQAIIDT